LPGTCLASLPGKSMPSVDSSRSYVGQQIAVRGRRWTVAAVTTGTDCSALRLAEIGASPTSHLTILIPFDRPRTLDASRSPRVVRPRRWLHELDRLRLSWHPFGSLIETARTSIRLMPYQLEPALAVLRHGATRVLIADEVGLGKTIQAGVVLLELAARGDGFRALVLVPAGLRDQWARELAGHFGLSPIQADAAWLKATLDERPPEVNPWSLPGIYIASHDFIKRPEVLRPLESLTWDLFVMDEAHAASSLTDRRLAAHAIASRSRRVILLTATPHPGNPAEFEALCRVGRVDDHEGAVLVFQRSRSDVGPHQPRRSVVLPVRPSTAERRMHELLDGYSVQVWREAGARRDDRARLVSIVLRKRALSSAGSLAASVRRRLDLLASPSAQPSEQLWLPSWVDEDPLEDAEPSGSLAVPGLDDPRREHQWLEAIAEAAALAAGAETKARFLLRFIRRVREPVIIFTEYRDTLARLEQTIATAGRSAVVLHGGMSVGERRRAQQAFTTSADLLLATDAAAEGLNLHHRCRLVLHYELPWNPSRLEQRAGRVDRIGQPRKVHEIALVAAGTAERLVLAPLAARAAHSRRHSRVERRMLDALTESRVADLVMSAGDPPEPVDLGADAWDRPCGVAAAGDLVDESRAEATRLAVHRQLAARSGVDIHGHGQAGPVVCSIGRSAGVVRCLDLVYIVAIAAAGDEHVHREPVVLQLDLDPATPLPTRGAGLRTLVRALATRRNDRLTALLDTVGRRVSETVAQLDGRARESLRKREEVIARQHASAARLLIQPGLFDRRALREAGEDAHSARTLVEESESRLARLAASAVLRTDVTLMAALLSAR
jgi:superfamily II DNA or RNA helicase